MSSLKDDLQILAVEDRALLEEVKELYKDKIVGQSHIYTCSNRLKGFQTLTIEQRTKLKALVEPIEQPKKFKFTQRNERELMSYDDYKDSYD